MGAGREAQVKNNQQVSRRTSHGGPLPRTVRRGCAALANRLTPPLVPVPGVSRTGARVSVGAANRGWGKVFF